jgi:hypothetical protein
LGNKGLKRRDLELADPRGLLLDFSINQFLLG